MPKSYTYNHPTLEAFLRLEGACEDRVQRAVKHARKHRTLAGAAKSAPHADCYWFAYRSARPLNAKPIGRRVVTKALRTVWGTKEREKAIRAAAIVIAGKLDAIESRVRVVAKSRLARIRARRQVGA